MASPNSSLTFFSVSPTNLLNNSGPLTIFGSLELRHLASCLAINVLPVPGGPYSINPLTCYTPYNFYILVGSLQELKALLKISAISLPRPPIPISSNLKSDLKIVLAFEEDYKRLTFPSLVMNSISVSLLIYPKDELIFGIPESIC